MEQDQITLEKLNEEIKLLRKELEKMKENINNLNGGEVELTDWAKKELEEARKRPRSEYVSLENVEKQILEK